jgi:hypothetical protein
MGVNKMNRKEGIYLIQLNYLKFKDENGHDMTIIIAIEGGQDVDTDALEKHLVELYKRNEGKIVLAANKWLEEHGIKIVPIIEWHEVDYSGFENE